MTSAETVRPRPRAFWADIRFVFGVLLVASSVAGVGFVVAAARQTSPVFAAAHTIVVGEPITTADVRSVDVALGQTGQMYLSADALADGAVASRTIRSGELIPNNAVTDAEDVRTTNVVVRSATDVPASVKAGTVVELWQAPLIGSGEYDAPRVLVADATVVSVTRDDSLIGGGAAALELVIPRAEVAATLAAVADDAALSIVPSRAVAP